MPLCYAYDTAEPHWALRSVCKHTHSAICRGSSPRAGAIKHSKRSAFYLLTYARNLLVRSVIILALTMSEDGTRGAAATRKRTPSTRQKYAVAGALCFFLHQSDKWHNEATPLNVRAVSVSLPVGLCRMANGGNTGGRGTYS